MKLQVRVIKLAGEFLFPIKLLCCFTWVTINDSVHYKVISILVNILIPELFTSLSISSLLESHTFVDHFLRNVIRVFLPQYSVIATVSFR